MTAHRQLKDAGITPTIDCERSYELGYARAIMDLYATRVEQPKPANRVNALARLLKRRYN